MSTIIRKVLRGGMSVSKVKKEKISQADRDAAIGRIKFTTNLEEAVGDADLVIEAVSENLDLKKKIFDSGKNMMKYSLGVRSGLGKVFLLLIHL